MSGHVCDLCGVDLGQATLNRISGLDVCDDCSNGNITKRLAFRGWQTNTRQWAEQHDDAVIYHSEVSINPSRNLRHEASFNRAGFMNKLMRLFSKSFTTGDPLFDKLISVETRTEELTKSLLSNEGAQSAILEICEAGSVVIEFGRLVALNVAVETVDPQPLELQSCVIMHYLENVEAGRQ